MSWYAILADGKGGTLRDKAYASVFIKVDDLSVVGFHKCNKFFDMAFEDDDTEFHLRFIQNLSTH